MAAPIFVCRSTGQFTTEGIYMRGVEKKEKMGRWLIMDIEELKELLFFIEEVNQDNTIRWDIPIGDGKWSINEIISHIWLWDKYSLNLMLPMVRQGVVLRFIDQSVINSNAEAFAKTLPHKNELIELLKETRKELITDCKKIQEKNIHFYIGKKEHNIATFVSKFITSHDKHHIKQIEEFIQRSKTLTH